MNPQQQLFLFVAILFLGFLGVLNFVQAHRKKERAYYTSGIAGVSMVFVVVLILLNQFLLALVLIVALGVLSAVALPSVRRFQERILKEWMAKFGQEVDLSAPLRLRDLFTTRTGWLRFAHRWGVGRYVFFTWLFMMAILGWWLFALSLWLNLLSIEHIVSCTVTFSTGFAIMNYYVIRSVLKESQLSKPQRT